MLENNISTIVGPCFPVVGLTAKLHKIFGVFLGSATKSLSTCNSVRFKS